MTDFRPGESQTAIVIVKRPCVHTKAPLLCYVLSECLFMATIGLLLSFVLSNPLPLPEDAKFIFVFVVCIDCLTEAAMPETPPSDCWAWYGVAVVG
jgi:hypothetical protein